MIFTNLKSHSTHFKFIICLGLLITSISSLAQQNKDTLKNAAIHHKILLVPFRTTMFMNEIGKDVNTTTHFSYKKITEAFRSVMDLALYNTFRQNYSTVSLLQSPKQADTTLAYVYNSIEYKYDLLPTDSSGESHAEFDPTLQKKHFIHNGQLQVPMDYSQRFMNTHISNPQLLPYLHKKYGADVFVFINEVDIKNVSNNSTEDLNESNYKREVTVQYSILNTQKHYLAKGILITYFPYTENKPDAIGKKYFTLIAQDMMKELVKGLQKTQVVKAQTSIK